MFGSLVERSQFNRCQSNRFLLFNLNEKAGLVDKSGTNGVGQWTTVNCSKKTPMTRNIAEESKKLWTNSFQLLARVDGKKYDDRKVRRSNVSLYQVLDEAMDSILPHSLD
jgi:hypothetical protein